MKKITAIFFLLLFCLSQTGHYLIYGLQKWHNENMVREAILSGIPDRYLEMIEYSSAIEWEEEGKEFKLKGKFYDVVRIKKHDSKTFLYCLNDKNDEELLTNFIKTVKSSNEKGKNDKHSSKFHLTDQYIACLIAPALIKYTVLHDYLSYEAELASNCLEVIIPPPWCLYSDLFFWR